MGGFVKGFITGIISSILVFTLIKFLLSFICVACVLFFISCITGVNLMSFANTLLVWVIWKIYKGYKKDERC